MCTLIMLRRPLHERWPLIVAANRDERRSRPALAPGRHWEDRLEIRAGLDKEANGSWLGVNDFGVMAAILNRRGTLGPVADKRSRGELVLEALDHADASEAASALAHLDPDAYRPFNLVIADNQDAFWIRNGGDGLISSVPIQEGLTMVTAAELNDPGSARIRRYLPLFRNAQTPEPETGNWSGWQLLLASTSSETDDPKDAMCIHTNNDYGTVSSSMLALPGDGREPIPWLFAPGAPDDTDFYSVSEDEP